jgi:hypothetical protein
MPVTKLNISLDEDVVRVLRHRAAQVHKPASRYLAQLIREDARRHQDELAAEGYRLLSGDTASFAEAALPVAVETWPVWNEVGSESDSWTNKRWNLLGGLQPGTGRRTGGASSRSRGSE